MNSKESLLVALLATGNMLLHIPIEEEEEDAMEIPYNDEVSRILDDIFSKEEIADNGSCYICGHEKITNCTSCENDICHKHDIKWCRFGTHRCNPYCAIIDTAHLCPLCAYYQER